MSALTNKQAVIFLTHRENERIAQHFLRLRRETENLLSCYLCVHEPIQSGTVRNGFPVDFRVDTEDAALLMPKRFNRMKADNRAFNKGYADLAYLPALLDSRLSSYEHLWMVEYDADYAGNWRHFFERTMLSRADFLGTTIYPKKDCNDWNHWKWFSCPAEVRPENQLRSFNPIVRFSRHFLESYANAVETDAWGGHTEALFPAIALYYGLALEDLGGAGPYCPKLWRNTNYTNTPSDDGLAPGTFIAGPETGKVYYHEAPQMFGRPDHLYHPIKVD